MKPTIHPVLFDVLLPLALEGVPHQTEKRGVRHREIPDEHHSLKARVLSPIRDFWRDLTRNLFGSYHPELHYMRGPGPKWREKHAYAPVPIGRPHHARPCRPY